MEIEVDPKTVFAAPFDRPQKVTPAHFGHIWVVVVCGDGPV